MTRQEYIDLFGEDPKDMFGPDWENTLAEFTSDGTCKWCGGDMCDSCGEGSI